MAPLDVKPNELEPYWIPFTPNRAFKKRPRLFAGAKGMHLNFVFVAVVAKPDDGPRPSRRVVRIAWQVAPQARAAIVRQLPGKGPVEPDKSVLNKLPYLRVTKCAHGFVFTGRHENPHIFGRQPSSARGRSVGLISVKGCFRPDGHQHIRLPTA